MTFETTIPAQACRAPGAIVGSRAEFVVAANGAQSDTERRPIARTMKTKIFLSALAGFVLGILAMWFVVKQTTVKVFTNQYLVSVMDQANVALHIRAGKQMELLANIEAALPSYVLAVDEGFRGNAESTNALWMVKAYYDRNQIVIPTEIQVILDSLPPKPPTACQIRLRALDKAPTTNAVDTGSQK